MTMTEETDKTMTRRQARTKTTAKHAKPEPKDVSSEVVPTEKKVSALARIPVIKKFVYTGPPEGGADADGFAFEWEPWAEEGARRRAKAGKSKRGGYAPCFRGAPSTTKQARVLTSTLVAQPTGHKGVPNGRDVMSRTVISHDPFQAYDEGDISSPIVIVLGSVGAGKSSFTKTVGVLRPLALRRRRSVVFDRKDQGGEGEYSMVCRRYGSEPIKFALDGTGSVVNILDPTITDAGGSKEQLRLLKAVASIAGHGQPLDDWEEKAIRAAFASTMEKFEGVRTPTLADMVLFLGDRTPLSTVADDLSDDALERLHQAGLSMRWRFDGLLDEYSGLFDGDTSKSVDLSSKLTVFDISQLPSEGPALPVVQGITNQWLAGRLRKDRGWYTNVINEEAWSVLVGPNAAVEKEKVKLSRGLGVSFWYVFHKPGDIPAESPGMAVIQEAQSVYAYRMERPQDAQFCRSTFGFDPDAVTLLENLNDGHHLFKRGRSPEAHVEHVRTEFEKTVTNTDEAMVHGGRS